jgi:hypothetical protein
MERGESSTSPIQPLSVSPPATSVLVEKSNIKYSLYSSFSCLHIHYKPKIQIIDRQSITTLYKLGTESLSLDVNYSRAWSVITWIWIENGVSSF